MSLFDAELKKHPEYSCIVTAHNANDNAETLIYRIAKGTGIRGLCGIAENRGIYYPAHVHNADVKKLMDKGWDLSVDELYKSGVTTKVNLSSDQNIRLFDFDLEDGSKGYAVGLNNIHSIMRYNTSKLYASAVYELSEYIAMGVEKKKRRQGIYVPKRSRKP